MTSRETEGVSVTLRQARELLEPLRVGIAGAGRAIDLLDRDLLPRTAGGDAYLVAGIIGPNNAGKSALFNALVGHDLSPSVPAGGATRRLVGAAHPKLLARLRSEPTLARFRLRLFEDRLRGLEDALRPADDPAELLVASEPDLPDTLMLIDTPDFDSILEDNRLASESLLAVADVVVAVVTRHSYQNREVVQFLRHWLDHGRPWMLVYNEAIDEAVARAHAIKLSTDVGTSPLATFWALHDLRVQRGEVQLEPRRLRQDDEAGAAPVTGTLASVESGLLLRDMLFDLETIADVKARAFAAALARLRDELGGVASRLVADATRARAVLAAVEARAAETGVRIASTAMPAGPFIDAFRTVLDRRSNPLSRGWRSGLRRLRLGLESIPALFGGRRQQPGKQPTVSLTAIEREALRKSWPSFWEELVRDLGREARHVARRNCHAAMVELLDADLADGEREAARERAERELVVEPADVEAFQQACEKLVDKAIEDRGFDLDIQAAADIATLMPVALAAVVIVKTGGLGSDIAAAGGGALSAFLIEKYAHLLGTGIMAEARRRWAEGRGGQLARVLTDAALPASAPRLRTSAKHDTTIAGQLRDLQAAIR